MCIESWPRLFRNLRSSFETELLEHSPSHVVAAWMGHSAAIMLKHYAQVTNEHFERAFGGKKSGAESGADVVQKAVQQVIAKESKEMTISNELATKPLSVSLFAIPCESQVFTAKGLSGAEGI